MNFGLTEEQLIARRNGLGGSDAMAVITGGEEWVALWKDKTGRERINIGMSEWDSALRHCTEGLQCDWFEHKHGREVLCRGQAVICDEYPIIRCTLDGFIRDPRTVFQAKHVSQFTPDPINWCVDKYKVQVQHEMLASNAEVAILSILVGMKQPELVYIERDPFFQDAYIERCKEFWHYVETDTPPPGYKEAISGPAMKLDDMREVDFKGNNTWADHAATWLGNVDAAKKFKGAEKAIKELIEDDVRKGSGHGIVVSRNKAGHLSIKPEK